MEDYRVETWMIHLTETEGKAQEGPFLYVGLPTPPKRGGLEHPRHNPT